MDREQIAFYQVVRDLTCPEIWALAFARGFEEGLEARAPLSDEEICKGFDEYCNNCTCCVDEVRACRDAYKAGAQGKK